MERLYVVKKDVLLTLAKFVLEKLQLCLLEPEGSRNYAAHIIKENI